MMTSYLNVSSASQLSADIAAIDLASQADGGNGTTYLITLQAGATLTESADISAINLTGNDTLTINGKGAFLNGADAYRGLFAYSGTTTIENLTIENAVAQGGAGGNGSPRAAAGARGLAAVCSSPITPPEGQPRRASRSYTTPSSPTRASAGPAACVAASVAAAAAGWAAPAAAALAPAAPAAVAGSGARAAAVSAAAA